MPLSATDDEYETNPSFGDIWAVAATAAMAASAYHGYRRNEAAAPVGWALWWGLWGALVPFITLPIAFAQGFAEPASPELPPPPPEPPTAPAGYGAYYQIRS